MILKTIRPTVTETDFPAKFDEIFNLFNHCSDFGDTLECHCRVDKNRPLCDLWLDLYNYCYDHDIQSIDNIQGVTFFEL